VVAVGGGVALVLDVWAIEFSELGPTARTVVMVAITALGLPPQPLERSPFEEQAGVNAPLLVGVHCTIIP
jgi:hypothetical protein